MFFQYKRRDLVLIIVIFAITLCSSFISFAISRTSLGNRDTVSQTRKSDRIYEDPNHNAPWPRIAWLMSYPNSGTSYTLHAVGEGGNRTTASNYGAECDIVNVTGSNLPLYSNSLDGPFVKRFRSQLPSRYILTKTHCGGRCNDCEPSKYVETKVSFLSMCAKGGMIHATNDGWEKSHVRYDPNLAQRAIHLIRNPFDNAVSNFHLERNEKKKKGRKNWTLHFSNDVDGFRNWCYYLDQRYHQEESQLIPKQIMDMFENVPCHAFFYRYAQWHNLTAHVVNHLSLPTLTVWYEDYETNFDSITKDIFDFLELEIAQPLPPFAVGKHYESYFTEEERKASMELVRALMSHKSWTLVERYNT